MIQKRQLMSEQDPYLAAWEETKDNIDPTAPPDESIEKIQQIARKHDVEESTLDLINDFLDFHDINPDHPPLITLRSGCQVTYNPDSEEVLKQLENAIISESLSKATAQEPDSWKEVFKLETQEIRDEIHYITNNANEEIIRSLFEILLGKEVKRKRDSLYGAAFPHLNADPEKVVETLEDTKSGMVLLLGKDTDEGLKRLKRIRNHLEQAHSRNSVLLKEQPEHVEQGFNSKLFMYATLSRYIIVEHTFPSGHLYELPYMDNIEGVMVFLREKDRGATRVANRLIEENPLVKEFTYETDNLEESLDKAVGWAEKSVEENIQLNAKAWEWYAPE